MTELNLVTQEFRLEQWKEIIQDRLNSGFMVDEYCKLHNLSRNSYIGQKINKNVIFCPSQTLYLIECQLLLKVKNKLFSSP